MSKYIIEIEDEPVNGLYKAKTFRTLVFDAEGLKRLEKVEEEDTLEPSPRKDNGWRAYATFEALP